MIAASTYLPRTSSSTIAASSIQGTGAQNFASALRKGCIAVSGTALGPNFSSRRRASSLVRPVKSGASLTEACGGLAASPGCGPYRVRLGIARQNRGHNSTFIFSSSLADGFQFLAGVSPWSWDTPS